MKNILTILLLSLGVNFLYGQIPVNPVCDEALEIPYSFSYSGFILIEDFAQVNTNNFQMRIDIAENDPDGMVLLSENHDVPFQKSGFFKLDIGKQSTDQFMEMLLSMNENQGKDYYIVVYLRDAGFQYNRIGSKLIQTVPYALVANSIGGIGERGDQGIDSNQNGIPGQPGINGTNGVNGLDGAPGAPGQAGPNGFGIMKMRSSPPNSTWSFSPKLYVDDGTNTSDGKPHLMHIVNGTWIQL